jgi:hypothetical protein
VTGGAGIRAAAELALAEGGAAVPAEDAPEAADMFEPGHGGDGGGPLDPMAAIGADLFGQPRRGRGGGRPKGSRNRVTETFRAYFLSLHRHPALALAEVASVPVEELARRLGCTRFDAMKLQAQCLTACLPYVEKRQPIALELPAGSGLTLVIGSLEAAGAPAVGAIDGAFRVVGGAEGNQGVAGDVQPELVSAELGDRPKSEADKGLGATAPLMAHQPAGGDAFSITHPAHAPDTATPPGPPETRAVTPTRATGRAEPPDQKFFDPAHDLGGDR